MIFSKKIKKNGERKRISAMRSEEITLKGAGMALALD